MQVPPHRVFDISKFLDGIEIRELGNITYRRVTAKMGGYTTAMRSVWPRPPTGSRGVVARDGAVPKMPQKAVRDN